MKKTITTEEYKDMVRVLSSLEVMIEELGDTNGITSQSSNKVVTIDSIKATADTLRSLLDVCGLEEVDE